MGFRVLDLLSPVSAAVANSQESCGFTSGGDLPREKVSSRKIIGSSVAMAGVLLYSLLAKTKAAKLPPKPVKIVVDTEEPDAGSQIYMHT